MHNTTHLVGVIQLQLQVEVEVQLFFNDLLEVLDLKTCRSLSASLFNSALVVSAQIDGWRGEGVFPNVQGGGREE